jgi:hypothetical protein
MIFGVSSDYEQQIREAGICVDGQPVIDDLTSAPIQGDLVERNLCPGCGWPESDTIIREAFDSPALRKFFERQYEGRADTESLGGFSYHVVRCRACALAYQRTIPGGDLLHEIYEEWIPPSEKERLHRRYDLDHYGYLAEQVQFVVQHFGSNPYSIRVFDFGMGWGEWASMARAFGCQVTGSELSPARIQHARSIGIEVIDWNEVPNRKFHFINTEQVFEHLLEPLATLMPLVGALEDNGILRSIAASALCHQRMLFQSRLWSMSIASSMGRSLPWPGGLVCARFGRAFGSFSIARRAG